MQINSRQQIRIDVISKFIAGDIQREDACIALGVSERQFRRILKKFKEQGIFSVIHGNIGRSPNNKIPSAVITKIVRIYNKKYKGFNITHFREKLKLEKISMIPSYTSLRKILLKERLIKARPKKRKRVHRPRRRYAREGLMVQIDGSHHPWFFGELCCLNAAIDDATGKMLGGKFSKEETTLDTMDVLEQILTKHGRFHMLYSDRAGIYGGGKRQGFSNVNRAMSELDIVSIQANTPQAKGRIERLFRTLQDRLVMEMRLRDIKTMEQANKYLVEEFIPMFNAKFAVTPEDPIPAYRELPEGLDFDELFHISEARKVATGNVVSFRGQKYVITSKLNYFLTNRYIDVRVHRNGEIKMYFGEDQLQFEPIVQAKRAA